MGCVLSRKVNESIFVDIPANPVWITVTKTGASQARLRLDMNSRWDNRHEGNLKPAESIILDTPAGQVSVTLVKTGASVVKLNVEAPLECRILREELLRKNHPRG